MVGRFIYWMNRFRKRTQRSGNLTSDEFKVSFIISDIYEEVAIK